MKMIAKRYRKDKSYYTLILVSQSLQMMNDGINLAMGISLQVQENCPDNDKRPFICILSIM